jgi:hypothetical protein
MSTITVTNIKATGETASRAATGVAASYATIAQQESPQSISKSFNVASVSDNGTGLTSINYTNDFSDANYITTYGVRDGQGENDSRVVMGSANTGYYATSSQRLYAGKPDAGGGIALDDAIKLMFVVHGDLA